MQELPRAVESAILKYGPDKPHVPNLNHSGVDTALAFGANDGQAARISPKSAIITGVTVKSRPRLYGDHLLKGYLTLLNAPGGAGKSIFSVTMGCGLALGRDLLGLGEVKPRKVLILNNEDPSGELQLRLMAIAQAYGFSTDELNQLPKMLKFQSGYHNRLTLAAEFDGLVSKTAIQGELINYCQANQIEALFLDPLVSLHDSPENDNVAMDKVIAILRVVAEEGGVGIYLVHHSKKGAKADTPDDSSRGASAIIAGVRANYGLAKMTRKEAEKFVLPETRWPQFIRLDSGKRNYAPNAAGADWFELKSIRLDVVDWETDKPVIEWVGVPVPAILELKDSSQGGWTLERVMGAIIPAVESPFTKTGESREKLMELLSDNKKSISASTLDNRMKSFPAPGVEVKQVWVNETQYRCWAVQRAAKKNLTEYHYAEV